MTEKQVDRKCSLENSNKNNKLYLIDSNDHYFKKLYLFMKKVDKKNFQVIPSVLLH